MLQLLDRLDRTTESQFRCLVQDQCYAGLMVALYTFECCLNIIVTNFSLASNYWPTSDDMSNNKDLLGKMVYELRPEVDWHKGKAVEWLLEEIQHDYTNMELVPIYIGDDVTDEDAFRSLRPLGGIGLILSDHFFIIAICRDLCWRAANSW